MKPYATAVFLNLLIVCLSLPLTLRAQSAHAVTVLSATEAGSVGDLGVLALSFDKNAPNSRGTLVVQDENVTISIDLYPVPERKAGVPVRRLIAKWNTAQYGVAEEMAEKLRGKLVQLYFPPLPL